MFLLIIVQKNVYFITCLLQQINTNKRVCMLLSFKDYQMKIPREENVKDNCLARI